MLGLCVAFHHDNNARNTVKVQCPLFAFFCVQRINAFKAMCGRGSEDEWRVSHRELERIQNEGLLPVPERY